MKKYIKFVIGIGLGCLLLWLLFRGVEWKGVVASIRNVKIPWLVLGTIPILMTMFARAKRWAYIVRAAKPVPFRPLFSATQIGYMAIVTLPLRLGEVVRAAALARLAGFPISKTLAMAALDRVADTLAVLLIMLVAAFSFPVMDVTIPAGTTINTEDIDVSTLWIRNGAIGLGVLMCGLLVALILLYINQGLALRLSDKVFGLLSAGLAKRIREMLVHFSEGLHVFRSRLDMAKTLGFSILIWGLFLVSAWCYLQAFSIEAPWYTVFVLQALVVVVIIPPGMPGFIGQFHAGVVAGLILTVPNITFETAAACAIVVHLLNMIPYAALGLFCLYWEQMDLLELSAAGSRAQDDSEDPQGH